jgi:hypothetical protein
MLAKMAVKREAGYTRAGHQRNTTMTMVRSRRHHGAGRSARVWQSEAAMSWMMCSCVGLAKQRRPQRLDRQELNRLNGPPSYRRSLRY